MKTLNKIKLLVKDIWKLENCIRFYVVFFGVIVSPFLVGLILVDLLGCWLINEN